MEYIVLGGILITLGAVGLAAGQIYLGMKKKKIRGKFKRMQEEEV